MNKKSTQFKLKKKTSAGECGVPGKRPCKEELKHMAKKHGANKSYVKSISINDINMRKINRPGGQSNYISPGNVGNAMRAETSRRISNIKKEQGYQTFINNKNAGPIVKRVNRFINQASKAKGQGAFDFQVPNKTEYKNLLGIGQKYANSKNLEKDMSMLDKGKALYHGWKLANKYPNIKKSIQNSLK
jgi:hypothetical protein